MADDQRTGQADAAPQAQVDAVADHVHELIPDRWLIDELVRRGVLTEEWKHGNASGGGTICRTLEHAQAEEREYIHRRNNRTGYDLLQPRPPESTGIARRLRTEWEPLQ